MPPARRFRISETLGRDYATAYGRKRGSVRGVLSAGLSEFTGDLFAEMRWAANGFRDDVFVKYGVKLVGWPEDVEFANMSKLSGTPTAKLNTLLDYWAQGLMYWEKATLGEVLAAQESVYNAFPGPQFPNPAVQRGQRNDVGSHRERPVTNPGHKWPQRYVRKGAKSGREVGQKWLWDEGGPAVGCGVKRAGSTTEGGAEEIEDTDEWEREAWRTRRLPSGELADDLIESF